MKTTTLKATACDCCGKKYARREQVAVMTFAPDGADFQVRYSACMTCAPKIPADIDLTNAALRRCIERVPQLMQFVNVGGAA